MDYEKSSIEKIQELIIKLGVSASETILVLRQDENYINRIENNETLTTMQMFSKICELTDYARKISSKKNINM